MQIQDPRRSLGFRRDIHVFRTLKEIPFISFPAKLDSMILAVCGNGEVSAEIDVTPRKMGSHHVMVLRPGHVVDRFETSNDFKGFFITVTEECLHHMLPSLQYVIPYSLIYNGDPMIKITSEEYESLSLIYDMFKRQLRDVDRPFGTMALESLCELLFYNALGIYALRTRDLGHKSRREELLSQFIETLEKNFKNERSVNFYADRLFVTPKHLSSVLKEVSGRTAGDWIDQRVILEAKLMLRSTGMNIQEISSSLNFSNQSFFGKYFKHLTGISPREYRTNLSDI
ncbi:MAG: helix-turn-helix domain-containing protein [Muribaculaceae bacterium]|nr:helix-turn-helix domain-containing protein [Muribaculaceae bacterium]